MLKKFVVYGLFIVLITVLVAGAINRTVAKSEDATDRRADGVAEGTGRGQSAGRGNEVSQISLEAGRGQGQEGQGNGGGQGQGSQERGYPNYQEAPAEWVLYEGTVSQVPADGVDLIIATAEGEILVGTGPLDLSEQEFVLQAGDPLQVYGYWEGEEFKAGELTHLESDMAITLRNEMGRPTWSGAGKNAINRSENNPNSGRDRNGYNEDSNQAGAVLAEVEQWITFSGTVISVDESALVVEVADDQTISIENRPWWFAREQGFAAATGDEISLIGFYEGEEFEVGQLNNLTNETMVQIREESGRPLWAGGRQRASQSLG